MESLQKFKLFENGELLGLYNFREINEITGIERSNCYRYATSGKLYKRRYKIERIVDECRVKTSTLTKNDMDNWQEAIDKFSEIYSKSTDAEVRKALRTLQPKWRKELKKYE